MAGSPRRSPARIVLAELSRYRGLLVGGIISRAVWELVPMQAPLLAGVLIDALATQPVSLYGADLSGWSTRAVVTAVFAGLLVVAALYGASAYAYTVTGARLGRSVVADLRRRLVARITTLTLAQHQHHGAGDLLDRALQDTASLRGFTEKVFIRAGTNLIRAGYPIAMLFVLETRLALIALSPLPLQWLITWLLQRRLHRSIQHALDGRAHLTTAVKETFDGIETLQGLHAEQTALDRVDATIDDVEERELATFRLTAWIRATVWTLSALGLALTWWQGGLAVIHGAMTVGTLVAFTGFAEYAYRPARRFTDVVNTYQRGVAALERIDRILSAPLSVTDAPDARPLQVREGHIELRGVSFRYRDEPVFSGINLTLGPGGVTAIVGPSGAGKSTLLRLLARLADPTEGTITIDGQRLDRVALDSLRQAVAVVPQHPVLFTGTVLDNVRLTRPDATAEQVRAALAAAHALDFVEALDDELATHLGRGGVNLSGGQLQRLAIARAVLSEPTILLLDEATSALDLVSESALVESVRQLGRTTTVVVAAHRPRTIAAADRVVVLEGGRIVDDGSRRQLGRSRRFRELVAEV